MTLNEFLSKLNNVKKTGNYEYTASCPGHDDKNPSLSVTERDGKILLHCHRGCSPEEIVEAMGLSIKDLFDRPIRCEEREPTATAKPVRIHVYRDTEGKAIARKLIHKKPDGGKYALWERLEDGAWHKGLGELKAPLYRINELVCAVGMREGAFPVYVVEGEKDADTMWSMGYIATTSPKGAGGKWENEYSKYFADRDVIIISDNDEAGEKYALTVKRGIISYAKTVRVIPARSIYEGIPKKGDISDIYEELGEERTKELLAKATEEAEISQYSEMPPYFYYYGKNSILRVDRPALASYIRKREHYLFEIGEGEVVTRRLWYRDGVYKPISNDELRALVKGYITSYNEGALYMADVEEVIRNITSDPRFVTSEELDADENIINFRNGILRLDTLELMPHSPDVYSTVQIDCDWKCEYKDTPVFDRFMSELCGEDSGRLMFLTEFLGVALSNVKGYRMKSALFMVGEGNTGKSQLKSLCERILGQRNCAAIDLNTLEARFGTSAIYGKRLAGSSDLSYMTVNELKIFKQVTGGDRIFAERKGQSPFYYTYRGVLWFCMNALPKFGGDRGDWVYDRINIIECNNVIPPERRDKLICDKMYEEREGIVFKAVTALRCVIKRGYEYTSFAQLSAKRALYARENNPVASFYSQCCVPLNGETPKSSVTATAMHKVFVRWCRDNEKGYRCSYNEFKNELCKLLKLSNENLIVRTRKGSAFVFTLNGDAYDSYYLPYI